MEIVELRVSTRSETGKKGARKCRKQGLVPGILYGKGEEPSPVAVDPKALDKVLHTHAGGNVVIKLAVDEKDSDAATVVVKELQIDNIRGNMRHVDFCHISLDERIRTEVPFRITGEAPGVKQGGILDHSLWELEIESLPLEVPDYIEVDVSGLAIGDSLLVSDLKVPEGVSVLSDWDTAVVSIVAPRVEAAVEAAPAPAEEVEPEVVGAKPEKEGEEGKEKEGTAEEKKPAEKRKS